MKLINKKEISFWAYEQCYNYENDSPEVRNLITEEFYAYLYCKFIANDKILRSRIKNKKFLRLINTYKRDKYWQRRYDENTIRVEKENSINDNSR